MEKYLGKYWHYSLEPFLSSFFVFFFKVLLLAFVLFVCLILAVLGPPCCSSLAPVAMSGAALWPRYTGFTL